MPSLPRRLPVSDALSAEQVAEPLSAEEERELRADFAIHGTFVYGEDVARLLATLDAARLAALPAKPDVGERLREDDLRTLAGVILGGSSYKPHRDAAERVLAALTEQEAGRE
jgi:hypothetical protein